MTPRKQSERSIQREIIGALRRMGFRVIHVPNGVRYAGSAEQRARQAATMRADGVVKGTPDLMVLRPAQRGGPDFGWMEVKREGGRMEPEQIAFRDSARADGFRHAVVRSLEDVIETLEGWGWHNA